MYVRVFQSKCLQISLLVWLLNISHIKCLEIWNCYAYYLLSTLWLLQWSTFGSKLYSAKGKKEAVEYLFQKNNKVGLIYINHRLHHRQRVKEVTMKTFLYLWRRNVWFTVSKGVSMNVKAMWNLNIRMSSSKRNFYTLHPTHPPDAQASGQECWMTTRKQCLPRKSE